VVHRDPLYRLSLKYLLVWIKENPGILQTKLYKDFPEIKREDMTYALYFAEKEGLVRREQKGRSYQLFFIREKDRNEPFLKLEDDEVDLQEKEEKAKQEEQEKAKQEEMARVGCRIALIGLVWLGVAGLAFAFTGPVGIVIAIAAFILWRIIEKNRLKKQSAAKRSSCPDSLSTGIPWAG